jgi:hypothetical protein
LVLLGFREFDRRLAIDEFAIQKGHGYGTVVGPPAIAMMPLSFSESRLLFRIQ